MEYVPTSFSVGVKEKVVDENLVNGVALPIATFVFIESLSGSAVLGRLYTMLCPATTLIAARELLNTGGPRLLRLETSP